MPSKHKNRPKKSKSKAKAPLPPHLSLSSLPPHILQNIAYHLHQGFTRSLVNLALTNKTVKGAVQPLLRRHVWVARPSQVSDLVEAPQCHQIHVAALINDQTSHDNSPGERIDSVARNCPNLKTMLHIHLPSPQSHNILLIFIIYKKANTAESIVTPFLPHLKRLLGDTTTYRHLSLELSTQHFPLRFDDTIPPGVRMTDLIRMIQFKKPEKNPFRKAMELHLERGAEEATNGGAIVTEEMVKLIPAVLPFLHLLSVNVWYTGSIEDILRAQINQPGLVDAIKIGYFQLIISVPDTNLRAFLSSPQSIAILADIRNQYAESYGEISSFRCVMRPLRQFNVQVFGCRTPFERTDTELKFSGRDTSPPHLVDCAQDMFRSAEVTVHMKVDGIDGGIEPMYLRSHPSVQPGKLVTHDF